MIIKQTIKMKRLQLLSVLCLFTLMVFALTGCKKNNDNTNNGSNNGGGSSTEEYVDLGLTSGTKWKTTNEIDDRSTYYTHERALSKFGNNLPTKEHFLELIQECEWVWQESGCYKVTGPNGKSFYLQADGAIDCEGNIINPGEQGFYWSRTSMSNSDWAYAFQLDGDFGYYDIFHTQSCNKYSVRLISEL